MRGWLSKGLSTQRRCCMRSLPPSLTRSLTLFECALASLFVCPASSFAQRVHYNLSGMLRVAFVLLLIRFTLATFQLRMPRFQLQLQLLSLSVSLSPLLFHQPNNRSALFILAPSALCAPRSPLECSTLHIDNNCHHSTLCSAPLLPLVLL